MDDDGDFVAVWDGNHGGATQDVFGRRFSSTGTALGGDFQVSVTSLDTQRYPAVAGRGDGSFVVVWQSLNQDGSSNGVFARRFAADSRAAGVESPCEDAI